MLATPDQQILLYVANEFKAALGVEKQKAGDRGIDD
jgi:hypothetical protein